VVVEPFGAELCTAQVGVLWFDVTIAGHPVHVGDAGEGANAIEASFHVIRALHELEAELNADPPPPFDAYPHPLNLNVGEIEGGDWRSTVAGECVTRFRFARYPGAPLEELRSRIEDTVARASAAHPYLAEHPAVVSYDGFDCEGYEIAADEPVVTELRASHRAVTGDDLALVASTATTDTRTFGLYGGIPSTCFGPYSEGNHAADERVYLPSITTAAQVLAVMVCSWCGVQ
jgi:acetylornithine deacetylase